MSTEQVSSKCNNIQRRFCAESNNQSEYRNQFEYAWTNKSF